MIRGIDVSHFQGPVNWKFKRSSQGLSFGMAKCVEALSFYDSQYVANREGCHLAGMPFIAYGFVRPEAGSALAQARYLVAKAGAVEGYCMDLEASALSQSETNAWMRAFGDDLRALTDKPTFAYLGGYAANGSGQGSVGHFDHWMYPHYTRSSWPTVYAPQVGGNTTGWKVPPAPSVWQCSDNIGGTDADVSPLALDQLFSGANMPLSAADIAAIWNHPLASKRPGAGDLTAAAFLTSIDVNTDTLNGLTADSIAAAVVKALPPSQGGASPTAAEIAAAVAAVFATKLGGTP